jgi:Flp pilus assembly pilin Flp
VKFTVKFTALLRHPTLSSEGDLEGKEVPATMSFYTALINFIRRDDKGQGLAEYALILALIAIVAILALLFLGGAISTILSTVGASV